MSIAYGGIIAFVFRGLNLVVALALAVLTSQQLGGAEGRGTFVLGITVIGIVTAMTGGLTAATAYQVSNQRRETGTVLLSGGAVASGLGVLAIATGVIGVQLFTGEASKMSLAVGFSSAAVVVLSIIAGVYLGSGALIRYNLALVAPPLFSFLCVVFTIFALDNHRPEAALAAFAIGQWITVPALLLSGAGSMLGGVRLDRALTGAILKFAAVAGISSGVSYLNYRADTLIVEHFEGKDGVGVYGNAVLISESVWQFSGSLALAAYARIGSLEQGEAALLTARLMRHTLVILLAVCGGLFLVADLLVLPFGDGFGETAPALRLLLPGTMFYGLAASFSAYYTYQRGKPWAAAVVATSGLVIDIGLALVLVPRMGVNGAALASSIAYSSAMLGAVAVFIRDAKLRPAQVFRFGRAEVGDYLELLQRVRGLLHSS